MFDEVYVSPCLFLSHWKQNVVNFTFLIAIKHFPEITHLSVCRQTTHKDPVCFFHSLQQVELLKSVLLNVKYFTI